MYEIFGIFDSAEEINACAAGLLAEGDVDNLRVLAKENGIPEAMIEGYIEDGGLGGLVDPINAAIGKLEVELTDYGATGLPASEVVGYLSMKCYEKESLAAGIRWKNKNLKVCMRKIEKEARSRAVSGTAVIPDIEVFKMAEEYYLEG